MKLKNKPSHNEIDFRNQKKDDNSADAYKRSVAVKEKAINPKNIYKTSKELAIIDAYILFSIDKSEITNDFKNIAKQVQDKLEKSGGVVTRENFGDVQVGSRLLGGGAYLKTMAEKTAVIAVPVIVEKGIKINEHSNHKNREYPTFTFAGKITIGGKTGIMAVVVKKTTSNFYKVHKVFTPSGESLKI